jgi:hypothetical protein
MGAVDPDSFIKDHGPEAMQAVIDDAIPLRARMLHDVLVKGACPERDIVSAARRLTERDLLEAAGTILSIVAEMRGGERADLDHRSSDAQRAVIALAARGTLSAQKIAAIPDDAFTGGPRLFAWCCAARACRILGRRTTFFHARYCLATAPRPPDLARPPITKADIAAFREAHGLEATEEWLLSLRDAAPPGSAAWLWRETEEELDFAESIEVPRDALGRLLSEHRARRVRTYLQPVLVGLEGEPVIDTAARLRTAADLFDGKERGRP